MYVGYFILVKYLYQKNDSMLKNCTMFINIVIIILKLNKY